MTRITCTLLFLAALVLPAAYAQTDTTGLEEEQIDIIKDFEPVVERANKKHFSAELPSIRTTRPQASAYNLPAIYRAVDYKPSELKPLGLAKEEAVSLPVAYLKAGFGSYLTPLVDFSLANRKTDRYRAGLDLGHLSSRRKKIENQRFSETGISALGEYYVNGMTVGAKPYFNLNDYYFYGYDQSDTSLAAEDVRNRYSGGGVNLYFRNHEPNAIDLDYATDLGFHTLKDGYGNKEFNFHWDMAFSKRFREVIGVGSAFFMDMTSLKSVKNQNRFALGFNPYVEAGRDRWYVRGGLWMILDDGTFYALPDIRHQSKLFRDYLVMYNEWTGHLELNSLRTLSEVNPWLAKDIRYNHYRVENRNFIGLKGHVPVGLDYDVRFAQVVFYDRPLLVNDTTLLRPFTPVYDDKLKAWNAHVSLGYQYADFLKIRAAMDYYGYKPEDEAEAWHLPAFRTSVSATYQFDHKLVLKAEVMAYSSVQARKPNGEAKTLRGTADLNFSASYQLHKYVAFFAQVNNAISLKHKRWDHYPGYGFMVLGGVVLSY